jgi:hypothetical protein
MDRPYIKTVVESYLIDKELKEEKFEELYNHIVENIDYMKENYECGYIAVHNMNKVEQQRYIYHSLDTIEEFGFGEISEYGPATSIALIAAASIATTWALDKYGHRELKRATTRIVTIWKWVHDAIEHKEWFKEHKVINKILDGNFSDCKIKAGFSANDSDLDLRIALKPRPLVIGPEISVDEAERGEALRDCYIDYVISVIAAMSILYVKCLEETGETTQQVSTDHGMGALLNYPTGEGCQVMHDKLHDQHKNFKDVLDVFFKDDRREKMNWIKRLDEKIRGAKRGEHLRPSIPRRGKPGVTRNRYISPREKGYTGNRNVNPTDNMYRR